MPAACRGSAPAPGLWGPRPMLQCENPRPGMRVCPGAASQNPLCLCVFPFRDGPPSFKLKFAFCMFCKVSTCLKGRRRDGEACPHHLRKWTVSIFHPGSISKALDTAAQPTGNLVVGTQRLLSREPCRQLTAGMGECSSDLLPGDLGWAGPLLAAGLHPCHPFQVRPPQ